MWVCPFWFFFCFMPFLVHALFGSCCFWFVPFLVRALFGSCCFWFVPFLVRALFGLCSFWFMPSFWFVCAVFGSSTCPQARLSTENKKKSTLWNLHSPYKFLRNIWIFSKISKECVFCSVLAVVPNQNDTQLSIKIYVKEDLVEFLETESHIKGSSKYSILFWIIQN